jgi:predicted CopG family antitoxin
MAKTKTIRVSEEELAALQTMREGAKAPKVTEAATQKLDPTAAQQALADAFVAAIERTRPPEKKTILTRKSQTPWTPKDGSPRLKMKRKFYHHGMLISENVTNAEIELLNQVKPGRYCDGFVIVTLRKDRGIDVDHPIRTASQRLRLVNNYGIRSFSELLQRIIDEKNNPSKYRSALDSELYDEQ